ncbi:MAG: hypothetical protein MRY63_04265 [Neomegalonema sp.]|nr:hypothetical protein [Neomegalonema sp.]
MLRLFGWIFLAAGLGSALWSGARAVSGADGWRLMGLDEVWFRLHAPSFGLLQPAIERHVDPDLWFDLVFPILQVPALLSLGGLGLALLLLSRLWRR